MKEVVCNGECDAEYEHPLIDHIFTVRGEDTRGDDPDGVNCAALTTNCVGIYSSKEPWFTNLGLESQVNIIVKHALAISGPMEDY